MRPRSCARSSRIAPGRGGARLRGQAEIRLTHSLAAAGAKMVQRVTRPRPGAARPCTAAGRRRSRSTSPSAPMPSCRPARAGASGGRRAALRAARRAADDPPVHQPTRSASTATCSTRCGRSAATSASSASATWRSEALALRGLRDLEHNLRGLVEPELAAAGQRTDDLVRQVDELQADAAPPRPAHLDHGARRTSPSSTATRRPPRSRGARSTTTRTPRSSAMRSTTTT